MMGRDCNRCGLADGVEYTHICAPILRDASDEIKRLTKERGAVREDAAQTHAERDAMQFMLTQVGRERDAARDRIDELLARNTQLVLQNRRLSIRTNVEQFHRVFEQPILERPQVPPEERVRHRLRLVAEEFFELLHAALGDWQAEPWLVGDAQRRVGMHIDVAPVQVDLPEFADALCDIDYVVEGTRLEFGIDGTPVLEEVQRANLAKAGVREDGKIAKPEGWVPPDVKGVLKKQGWVGQ